MMISDGDEERQQSFEDVPEFSSHSGRCLAAMAWSKPAHYTGRPEPVRLFSRLSLASSRYFQGFDGR